MNKAANVIAFAGLLATVIFSMACLVYLRQYSASTARLQASLRSNAADARKLIEQADAGTIILTDTARQRLHQIEARAK
jgi:hypothetical protein